MRDETEAWSREHPDESGAQAEMVARVAAVTISCTEATLAEARTLTADMGALLRNWLRAQAAILQRLTRPEWLLDGWEQIGLLWRGARTDGERRAVLVEMVLLVPIIPREAADWIGQPIDMDGLTRLRRTIKLNEDWRTGTEVLDLIARNEHLRALAA